MKPVGFVPDETMDSEYREARSRAGVPRWARDRRRRRRPGRSPSPGRRPPAPRAASTGLAPTPVTAAAGSVERRFDRTRRRHGARRRRRTGGASSASSTGSIASPSSANQARFQVLPRPGSRCCRRERLSQHLAKHSTSGGTCRSRPVSRVLFRGPRGPRRRTFLSGARCRAPPASSTRRLDRASLDPLALARGSTAVASRRRRPPPYSLLHRVGFAMPRRLPGVRCALTAPFHPCHALLAEPFGGLLSVALSCGSPRPVVNRHPALRCSDFPRRLQPCKPTRSPERLRRGGCNTGVPGWQTRSTRRPGARRMRRGARRAQEERAAEAYCFWYAEQRSDESARRSPRIVRRSYRRSSMARLLISSAAAFSSRGMCATRTSGKARRSCFASSWSGFR